MANDIHDGHRQRLKKRFLQEGLDSFEHHNVLELLLFYGIPRIDTNEIAHVLIQRFGSLSEVFDAPYEELIKIKGVSANVATLIKLMPSLCRVYMQNRKNEYDVFDSTEKMGEYFVNKFIGITKELVYLLLLDNSGAIISCDLLATGTVSQANISIRKITDIVIKHNACSVVLAHNHPRGLAVPSNEDVATSLSVKNAMNVLNIQLLDHIIVAANDYVSLADLGYITQ